MWGGNFPSLYSAPVLNAPYIDWMVRGQGEHTFAELQDVLRGARDPKTVAGLSFRDFLKGIGGRALPAPGPTEPAEPPSTPVAVLPDTPASSFAAQ